MKKLLFISLITLFAITAFSQQKPGPDSVNKKPAIAVNQDTIPTDDKQFINAKQIESVMALLDEKLISAQFKIVRTYIDELYKVAWRDYYLKKKAELEAIKKEEEPPGKAKRK